MQTLEKRFKTFNVPMNLRHLKGESEPSRLRSRGLHPNDGDREPYGHAHALFSPSRHGRGRLVLGFRPSVLVIYVSETAGHSNATDGLRPSLVLP